MLAVKKKKKKKAGGEVARHMNRRVDERRQVCVCVCGADGGGEQYVAATAPGSEESFGDGRRSCPLPSPSSFPSRSLSNRVHIYALLLVASILSFPHYFHSQATEFSTSFHLDDTEVTKSNRAMETYRARWTRESEVGKRARTYRVVVYLGCLEVFGGG